MGLNATYATAGFFPSTAGFVDETSRLLSIQITRGKDQTFGVVNPGLAVLQFENNDGRFSPSSGGSSGSGVPGGYASNLAPRRPVKITAALSEGAAYGESQYALDSYGSSDSYVPFYRGTISSIAANLRRGSRVAEIGLSDGIEFFETFRRSVATYPSEPSSAIIARALSEAGTQWASAFRNDNGPGELTPASFDMGYPSVIMDTVRAVVESENRGAIFYIAKDGRTVFRGATARDALPAAASLPMFTDGDVWDMHAEFNINEIWTEIAVHGASNATNAVQGGTGLVKYGLRRKEINARFRTDGVGSESGKLASGLRNSLSGGSNATFGLPFRPTITLRNNSLGMLSQILGRELNEPIRLQTTSTGGPVGTQQGAWNRSYWIDSMSITADNAGGNVEAVWGLSPHGLAGTT